MDGQLSIFDLVDETAKNEPLLEIGQTVWFILSGTLLPGEIKKIWQCPDHYSYDIEFEDGQYGIFKDSDIGVKAFLTNEDALKIVKVNN